MFLILAAQYESWSLPFSVLLGTPIAVLGAFLALWLRAFENNIFAQIGLVMLIGLAAKNAILIVEFAKLEYERGTSSAEAALAGARLRLRPILMTAFAFILGVVPLAISTGSGAEARKLLGTTVIGGMLAASLIAIFLIPVSFYVVERLASRGEPEPAPPPVAATPPWRGPGVNARRMLAATLVLSPPAARSGPTTVAPSCRRPPPFATSPKRPSIADLPWWEVFRDETLHGAHPRVAREQPRPRGRGRERRARALPRGGAARRVLPAARLRGQRHARQGHLPGHVSSVGRGTENDFLAVLNLFWEIDVWGRIRRASEAARAELLASEALRRGVVLSLVSDVAQAWFELLELDRELEIARGSVHSYQETYDLFQRQFLGGVTSKLDPLRAEAALAQAAAHVYDLEQRIVEKENQLSVLLGRPAGSIPRGAPLGAQATPPDVPIGVPARLLERRPDLIEAEETLIADNARVGQALANYFPQIGLTALAGSVSTDLSDLLESGTGAWSAGAQALGPLFTFGQTTYTWRAAQAATDTSRAAYEGAVLNALREVSDALTARQKLVGVRAEQERAVSALRESVNMARTRYLGGLSTYLDVLDAQQAALSRGVRPRPDPTRPAARGGPPVPRARRRLEPIRGGAPDPAADRSVRGTKGSQSSRVSSGSPRCCHQSAISKPVGVFGALAAHALPTGERRVLQGQPAHDHRPFRGEDITCNGVDVDCTLRPPGVIGKPPGRVTATAKVRVLRGCPSSAREPQSRRKHEKEILFGSDRNRCPGGAGSHHGGQQL